MSFFPLTPSVGPVADIHGKKKKIIQKCDAWRIVLLSVMTRLCTARFLLTCLRGRKRIVFLILLALTMRKSDGEVVAEVRNMLNDISLIISLSREREREKERNVKSFIDIYGITPKCKDSIRVLRAIYNWNTLVIRVYRLETSHFLRDYLASFLFVLDGIHRRDSNRVTILNLRTNLKTNRWYWSLVRERGILDLWKPYWKTAINFFFSYVVTRVSNEKRENLKIERSVVARQTGFRFVFCKCIVHKTVMNLPFIRSFRRNARCSRSWKKINRERLIYIIL